MLDYLIWFKSFIDNYESKNKEEPIWSKIESANNIQEIENNLIGSLKQDSDGNYFINNYIFQYNKVHNIYNTDDEIEILKSIPNTNTTKGRYPFFVINFKKL